MPLQAVNGEYVCTAWKGRTNEQQLRVLIILQVKVNSEYVRYHSQVDSDKATTWVHPRVGLGQLNFSQSWVGLGPYKVLG